MARYFGTDGIRGSYGDALINPDFAFRLGSAFGQYLARGESERPLQAVIGRDTRLSGPALSQAFIQGLNRQGVHVYDAGIVPTPAIAHAVLELKAAAGIAITASHNPASDNGIKFFNSEACKYDEASELEIEALVEEQPPLTKDLPLPESLEYDAATIYVNYIRSLIPQSNVSGCRIVLDLANGATCETTPAVFRSWGAELDLIGDNPDGDNINEGVGSEHPEQLGAKVRELGANLGIAHDGDGDRVVFCDENGDVLEGEVLLALFGIYALRSDALVNKTLVTTVHSNLGLDRAIRDAGGQVQRVDVGDRNVAKCMREVASNVGGESSGHIILSDFATTGDGLLAAVKLVELISKTGQPLSDLRKQVQLFPHQTRNLIVAEKLPIENLEHLSEAIQRSAHKLGDEGRVLVRYSGTEPKLRILVEGKDEATISAHMQALEQAARKDLEIIDS